MRPENEEWVGDIKAENSEELKDESSEEEALSLCDLPIKYGAFQELAERPDNYSSVVSSRLEHTAADSFEFFTRISDMCPADDIIFSGKLLPLKHNQCRLPTQSDESSLTDGLISQNTRCRRSESLSKLRSGSHSSNSIKARAVRTSRSLDDRRNSQSSFVSHNLHRNSSDKSLASSSSKTPKSRWHLLISGIGMVKFPPEMELRDIKNRQSRRSNSTTLLPGSEAVSTSTSRSNNGSSWSLIKALSCKDHRSISVTASFVCMPHI